MLLAVLLSVLASENKLAGSRAVNAQPTTSGTIAVKVTNIRPVKERQAKEAPGNMFKGTLQVSLYASEAEFQKKTENPNLENAYRTLRIPATAATQIVEFKGIPFQQYLATVEHDANGDGKMTRPNLIRLVTRKWEPFGVTQLKKVERPSWKANSFRHAMDPTVVQVELLHP